MSVNRSEEIRRFYEKNPGARPKDCITALAAQGIDVSPTLVSCVRAKLRDSVPQRDMAVDVESVRSFVDSSGLDSEVAVEILSRFAGVVEKVGGLVRFREVLAEIGGGGGLDNEPGPLGPGPVGEPAPTPEPTPTPTPGPSVFGLDVGGGTTESAGFFYDDVNDEDDD